jgi:hypothetical protein
MVDRPYSGTTVRAGHYSVRPSVPGINRDHFDPDPEPDPFNPQPDTPPNQEGTVLVGESSDPGQSNQPTLATQPFHHWYDGQPPVASGVPYGQAQQAMQERLMVDHADTNYVPDSARLYQHATEGQANEFLIGRQPQNAGVDPGEDLQYLVAGTNSYDATNQPNDVYAGDPANVGRYRLGVKTNVWGLYQNPLGKFGQDAVLRAYTGLHPAFPVDKPPMDATAPYTPNSTGTSHWLPATFAQVPSLFALPSETALTDYAAANEFTDSGSDFRDRGGDF